MWVRLFGKSQRQHGHISSKRGQKLKCVTIDETHLPIIDCWLFCHKLVDTEAALHRRHKSLQAFIVASRQLTSRIIYPSTPTGCKIACGPHTHHWWLHQCLLRSRITTSLPFRLSICPYWTSWNRARSRYPFKHSADVATQLLWFQIDYSSRMLNITMWKWSADIQR
jgi:hypothetical protein